MQLAHVARPALALGAGATVALALPPWGFWPLSIVGVVLFGIVLGAAPSRRECRRYGWLFGAGWMYLGMGWMVQLTVPGYLVAAAIFAGFHAAAAAVSPTGPWRVVGRPAAHAAVEALRFSFPFGGVPLASMGIAQVSGPLAGVARVGGVILLTWLVFQLGFAIAALVDRRITPPRRADDAPTSDTSGPAETTEASETTGSTRSTATAETTEASETTVTRPGAAAPVSWRRELPALAGFAAVAIVIGASVVAPTGTSTGETLRVAAVQGGGRQGTSALDVPSSVVTERHLEATASIAVDPDLDLVFWPENTMDVARFEGSEPAALITEQAARLGVPISVGLTEDVITDDGSRRFTNAQVVVTPDGEITSRYDKVRRVPFGEYVPFRSVIERITSAVDRVGEAVAGTDPAVIELPTGERLATVISWEVFFGGRAREGVKLGAHAIVNPTNGASYTGTIVQTQQVASSRLRAIETGRWVIQAAPTGFTAFVSPDGEVVERSSQREQIVITRDIELRTGNTWYTDLGDGPIIAALLALLAVAIWRGRDRSDVTSPRAA